MDSLERIKGGLIVSCQAHFDHPLEHVSHIVAMAKSAEKGGAVGIRADNPQNISGIKKEVNLPLIGIYKVHLYDKRFFITPTFEHAKDIVSAGADIIALEASYENHSDDSQLSELIQRIRNELKVPVMADVSTYEEGERAWEMGADLISTTLSGYTEASQHREKPDLSLIKELSSRNIPTVCEGHIRNVEQVQAAMDMGSWCVVVGTAITDPISLTSWFASGTKSSSNTTGELR